MSDLTAIFTMDSLQAVRGAIHVHTSYNDGDEDMASVVTAADDAGLDFLAVTDHHEPFAARGGWSGRKRSEKTLVLVGTEYRTADQHDIIGFGLTASVATRNLDSDEALRLLRNLGATTFIAHPQGHRSIITRKLIPWKNYNHQYYNGIEVWSYMHDWVKSMKLRLLPGMCRRPIDFISGPEDIILRNWDLQAMVRKVAGIGALDSHGRRLPLGLSRILPWARDGILPYRQNFAAFSHYTMVPTDWGNDDKSDMRALTDSLAGGHGWACHEELGSGREFIYMLRDGGEYYPVGSEREFNSEQMLIVSAPSKADIALFCRGEVVERVTGHELEFFPGEPGEYRVEVRLENQPWIYSNHIYLR